MHVADHLDGLRISLAALMAPRRHAQCPRMPHSNRYPSDVRTQLIILHTRLHLLRRCLQELSAFQPNPDPNHGEIAFSCALEERCAATLGAELAEDGESAGRG